MSLKHKNENTILERYLTIALENAVKRNAVFFAFLATLILFILYHRQQTEKLIKNIKSLQENFQKDFRSELTADIRTLIDKNLPYMIPEKKINKEPEKVSPLIFENNSTKAILPFENIDDVVAEDGVYWISDDKCIRNTINVGKEDYKYFAYVYIQYDNIIINKHCLCEVTLDGKIVEDGWRLKGEFRSNNEPPNIMDTPRIFRFSRPFCFDLPKIKLHGASAVLIEVDNNGDELIDGIRLKAQPILVIQK